MNKKIIALICVAMLFFAFGCGKKITEENKNQQRQKEAINTQIANPASENCRELGGKTVITEHIVNGVSKGQYGICFFEDNRQCEEWSLFRGECPIGGVKVTGYTTDAAVYCVIHGGEYTIKAPLKDKPDVEQGDCKLKNGKVCDAWEYFNGICKKND